MDQMNVREGWKRLVADNQIIDAIEGRVSVNLFDPLPGIADEVIAELVRLATRAPSAFNLQNWRFIAARSVEAKERLYELSGGQVKIRNAAVTFIICGQLPAHQVMAERLHPSVEAGFMPPGLAEGWARGAESLYSGQPRMQRDEAIRTATFGAATLVFAAEALGLASCPMVGFDPQGVREAFDLKPDEVPVMLVAVGHAAPGNWPQKPRRPLAQVLDFV